jgi:hypothetical protein
MAHFRVIRIKPAIKGERGAWAVEGTALGETGDIVSPLFATRAEAKLEAERLTAQERKNKLEH